MTHKITATAPTVYQLQSLRAFGMEVKSNPDGSFTASQEFATREEAKEFLKERAYRYYDEFEGQADRHYADIEKYGQISIDAVTASIHED